MVSPPATSDSRNWQIYQHLYIGLLKPLKRLTCLGAFLSIITGTNRRLAEITSTPIGSPTDLTMLDSILLLTQNRESVMGYSIIEKMELTNVRDSLGILYPRGATVGGSSQVNAMNFVLPPDNDWLHIAQLTGDRSWEPENMRKFFTEFEKNEYLSGARQPGHGYNGYISVRRHGRVLHITAKYLTSHVDKSQ